MSCQESHFIAILHRIEEETGTSCIKNVGKFKKPITSKKELLFSRHLYSMNIADPVNRTMFIQKGLKNKELRFLA